jgi:hypothetical protein
MKTVFLRALESDDKAATLLAAIRDPKSAKGRQRFEVDVTNFAFVPGSPFAYWVSEKLLRLFATSDPMNGHGRLVVSTNPLNDDFRYVRAWWEPAAPGLGALWKSWAKGGAYSPFYYDIDTVISWDDDRSTYAGFLGTENRPLERPASVQHFFRPALTWPRRTNGLSLRAMPKGSIFADKGPAILVEYDNSNDLLALAAVANSRAFTLLVSLQLARTELAQSYEVGLIQNTPVPHLGPADHSALAKLATRAWSLKRTLDTHIETSHAYLLPALLQVAGRSLETRANNWISHVRGIVIEVAAIREEIDACCFDLYGIDVADQRAITDGFGEVASQPSEQADTGSNADTELDDIDYDDDNVDASSLTADLASWAVAVALGRFDVRVATEVRQFPSEPKPFDPLPACSPAMLTGDDDLPRATPPVGYPIAFPENGLLVDDPGHARDITAAVRAVFEEVFKESADAWWNDVGALLDPKKRDLRDWLATSFFERHLKRHSKSRRKSPIIWQLAVPSGRYSVWLYAHRITRDSFIQVQNDLVAPKLDHEERRLASLVRDAGANPSSKESKEIEAQDALVGELRDFLDKVKRVAPLWRPTLDDGVVLTMAPLWQLVPQHKPWQKELKSKWDDLVAGKFDWAHLAMHLWPERVVPKCAEDRSLAIAHGLEDALWFEDEDGKWKPRKKLHRSVDDLVSERTSTAVKAALTSLLDSPGPTAGAKRSRKSKVA